MQGAILPVPRTMPGVTVTVTITITITALLG
jgi:hypothetical protein